MTRKTALALLALAMICRTLPALETRDGSVRLTVDERNGRFSFQYLADPAKGSWVPLFYAEETRTTYATISVDGKTSRLGDSSEYRVTVSRNGSSITVEYRSALLVIRQVFTPLVPPGAALASGLAIEWKIENVGARDARVGLRFLLDTSLGERSGIHFELPSRGAVPGETVLEGAFSDDRVLSPGSTGTTLQVAFSGASVDTPDRVVLANWKRLDDAAWMPETSAGRSFTLLPYSINDSAAALFWEPRPLARGASLHFRTALGTDATHDFGAYGAPGAAAAVTVAPPPATDTTTPTPVPAGDAIMALRSDLAVVKSLIELVDDLIASDEPDAAELARARELLERLYARRSAYQE
ncbi:MAG: hypothetical protein JXA15_14655 [Spirochaetales bacterium]|nr:hypothetical protein [Spirochaetales bacterium]